MIGIEITETGNERHRLTISATGARLKLARGVADVRAVTKAARNIVQRVGVPDSTLRGHFYIDDGRVKITLNSKTALPQRFSFTLDGDPA